MLYAEVNACRRRAVLEAQLRSALTTADGVSFLARDHRVPLRQAGARLEHTRADRRGTTSDGIHNKPGGPMGRLKNAVT